RSDRVRPRQPSNGCGRPRIGERALHPRRDLPRPAGSGVRGAQPLSVGHSVQRHRRPDARAVPHGLVHRRRLAEFRDPRRAQGNRSPGERRGARKSAGRDPGEKARRVDARSRLGGGRREPAASGGTQHLSRAERAHADAGDHARRPGRRHHLPGRRRSAGFGRAPGLLPRLAALARQSAQTPLIRDRPRFLPPSMSEEPCLLSASALLEGYRTQTLSPVEVTKAVLARIESLNPRLNAFNLVSDHALDEAKASEARWLSGQPQGLLDGVPVSIKDLVLTRGWPTLRGSKTVNPKGPW